MVQLTLEEFLSLTDEELKVWQERARFLHFEEGKLYDFDEVPDWYILVTDPAFMRRRELHRQKSSK